MNFYEKLWFKYYRSKASNKCKAPMEIILDAKLNPLCPSNVINKLYDFFEENARKIIDATFDGGKHGK